MLELQSRCRMARARPLTVCSSARPVRKHAAETFFSTSGTATEGLWGGQQRRQRQTERTKGQCVGGPRKVSRVQHLRRRGERHALPHVVDEACRGVALYAAPGVTDLCCRLPRLHGRVAGDPSPAAQQSCKHFVRRHGIDVLCNLRRRRPQGRGTPRRNAVMHGIALGRSGRSGSWEGVAGRLAEGLCHPRLRDGRPATAAAARLGAAAMQRGAPKCSTGSRARCQGCDDNHQRDRPSPTARGGGPAEAGGLCGLPSLAAAAATGRVAEAEVRAPLQRLCGLER